MENVQTSCVCEQCGKISSTPINLCFDCFREMREEDEFTWN